MTDHHQRNIARLAERIQQQPEYLALIVGGSVAKGLARDDSDIDVLLIATDEEFDRRQERKDYTVLLLDHCDYEGGYVDGKVVNRAFLDAVAERGSEPARSAFEGAFVAWSRGLDLMPLIERIRAYPEAERAPKMAAFAAQLLALRWYVGEAEKRNDLYLMTHVATEMTLFAGRLVLAHNRMLFPYHKWFWTYLERAEEKPEGFMKLARNLLACPSQARAAALFDATINWQDWGVDPERWGAMFMEQREWNWMEGRPPLEDW
ncbi:MAG TPA: nucleotidyltransferase domain-containing protein [Armatimonadota bacterium]|jgi:predicted nucleotidyltransferase